MSEVFAPEWVAALARQLICRSPPRVLSRSDRLQVIRADTTNIRAQMVDLHPRLDRAVDDLVQDAIGAGVTLAFEPDYAVPVFVECARPIPTPICDINVAKDTEVGVRRRLRRQFCSESAAALQFIVRTA